ncbi:replication-associated recombination protein A [Pseudofrankia sp. DC12]|uniref:replication-associated recombination protein A n=1 Tax=Pseudofrankia sp. DC12 TaxID=683315 RepID=UPI0005F7C109|nr:replication-associated recombination protein A [Pseudofrankia sp. DC12]
MSLFDTVAPGPDASPPPAEPAGPLAPTGPLADRLRPRGLDELVGQRHLLGQGSPLRRLVEGGGTTSVVLWGPPGTGKTTLAHIVSQATGRRFRELSAVTAGVKDVRAVIDEAREALSSSRPNQSRRAVRDPGLFGEAAQPADGEAPADLRTVLFIDEVHRFTRTQQDALLPAVERGWITLVAATTENPSFSVVAPLLSRSLLFTLTPLTDGDIRALVRRALADPRGYGGRVRIADDALEHLVRLAGGDARRALTALEASAEAALAVAPTAAKPTPPAAEPAASDFAQPGPTTAGLAAGDVAVEGAARDAQPAAVDLALLEQSVNRAAVRYDRDGDQHYDVVSAFIKSMRGGDADAALHYLARMIEAGEDPRFIARRMIILASEDIGMADPGALGVAVSAAQALELVGLPEARLALAQAVIHLALAPKSNAVIRAMDAAAADVRAGKAGPVPGHLRDAHYQGARRLGHGDGYCYPHDYPEGVARQQYPPDELVGVDYYRPGDLGFERRAAARAAELRAVLRAPTPADAPGGPLDGARADGS